MPFLDTLGSFKLLRPSVRALVFLYWIYAFAGGMVGIFTQIFLYQRFTSVSLNVLATLASYAGIALGFCIPGLLAGAWRISIKHGFLASFIVTAAAILYFLEVTTTGEAYAAMFLWGFGGGIFWLTVNTFELSETEDRERDFYASALNAGNQVLSLAGPAAATVLIWLSGTVFHIGTYTLLFTAAPAVYFLGFFCFAAIRDYRPEPVRWADVKHYVTDPANRAAQLYTAGMGFQQTLSTVVPPLAVLVILGTAVRVGIYNTLFAILSALCVLAVARYRTEKNRLVIYGVTTACLALATFWFGFAFGFLALVVYTFVDGIVSPVMNVSSHVTDLASMEIGRAESDFYPTMILRDVALWFWRSVGGLVFLAILGTVATERGALSAGFYLIAAAFIVTYLGAVLFLKIRDRQDLRR